MLAQYCSIGRIARYAWVVLIYGGVVVSQKVGTDVFNMLPVFLAEVTRAVVVAQTVAEGQPCGGGVDVSLVIDDLVDLCGDMVFILSGETADDKFVIVVITGYLAIYVVRLAAIRTG